MFILNSILSELQLKFKKSQQRGKLFTAVLLAILFPVSGARGSQILRTIKTLFGFAISARRFYIFMASPKLPWACLWRCLWSLIPDPLTDGRLILAADDSVSPKTGKKIFGCGTHFDHSAKTNQAKFVWAQNIVQVCLVKWIHGRFACLPLIWKFYHLKNSAVGEFKTKLDQVSEMVVSIYKAFQQPILLVVDSWFSSKTLINPLRTMLKDSFHILSRLRTNTNLYSTKTPKYRGRGRKPKYGKRVGNVKKLGKKKKHGAKKYSTFLYGAIRDVLATSEIFYLKTLGLQVRIVWVYYRKNTVAFFTTDLTLSVEKIIEYYGARWKIESGFKELKQEIGSQRTQARSENAVTNHLNFCMMSVALTWIYAAKLNKQPARRNSANRRTSFSFSDVRYLISQEFSKEDFLRVFFKSKKAVKNNLIPALLKLAA
jgi:DDE superfamily endonuclease